MRLEGLTGAWRSGQELELFPKGQRVAGKEVDRDTCKKALHLKQRSWSPGRAWGLSWSRPHCPRVDDRYESWRDPMSVGDAGQASPLSEPAPARNWESSLPLRSPLKEVDEGARVTARPAFPGVDLKVCPGFPHADLLPPKSTHLTREWEVENVWSVPLPKAEGCLWRGV